MERVENVVDAKEARPGDDLDPEGGRGPRGFRELVGRKIYAAEVCRSLAVARVPLRAPSRHARRPCTRRSSTWQWPREAQSTSTSLFVYPRDESGLARSRRAEALRRESFCQRAQSATGRSAITSDDVDLSADDSAPSGWRLRLRCDKSRNVHYRRMECPCAAHRG